MFNIYVTVEQCLSDETLFELNYHKHIYEQCLSDETPFELSYHKHINGQF